MKVADAALQREVVAADSEFLAWKRKELEPQVDGLQRDREALQQQVTHLRYDFSAF